MRGSGGRRFEQDVAPARAQADSTLPLGYRTLNKLTRTDDLRIRDIAELVAPVDLVGQLPATDAVLDLVTESRGAIRDILSGTDDRLLVVIGPCSIHDPASALEYARRLVRERARFSSNLEIVMRVYFEKPRTTVGWKGLINDPFMDDSFAINDGLRIARGVLLEIDALGLPTGSEFLDTITPQYVADLISWGAIGARTTESQVHRELASGLSCPVGFKNGTDGNIRIAIDALKAASHPHHFLSVTKSGRSAIVTTTETTIATSSYAAARLRITMRRTSRPPARSCRPRAYVLV